MLLKQICEQLETKNAEEIWSDISSGVKVFTPSLVYEVRPHVSKSDQFEVYTTENSKRTPFATMSSAELKDTLEKIRHDDKPDAEGFTQYRSKDTLEAAQYNGDPLKVSDLNGVLLKRGDFLVRTASNADGFVFSIENKSFFKDNYTEV